MRPYALRLPSSLSRATGCSSKWHNSGPTGFPSLLEYRYQSTPRHTHMRKECGFSLIHTRAIRVSLPSSSKDTPNFLQPPRALPIKASFPWDMVLVRFRLARFLCCCFWAIFILARRATRYFISMTQNKTDITKEFFLLLPHLSTFRQCVCVPFVAVSQ